MTSVPYMSTDHRESGRETRQVYDWHFGIIPHYLIPILFELKFHYLDTPTFQPRHATLLVSGAASKSHWGQSGLSIPATLSTKHKE